MLLLCIKFNPPAASSSWYFQTVFKLEMQDVYQDTYLTLKIMFKISLNMYKLALFQ